jgi:hypothetical protein
VRLAPAGSRAEEGGDIRDEYVRRLGARRDARDRHDRIGRLVANARLVVFAAGVLLFWLVAGPGLVAPGWLAAPAVLFVALIAWHARASREGRRAALAVAFYEGGLARLDGRWAGAGEAGLRFLDAEHPYAADLDLFGAGSLFERLCAARTGAGQEALAGWLLRPATIEEIGGRHEAIDELRARIDLSEELDLLAIDVRDAIAPGALAAWGAAPPVFAGRSTSVAAGLLSALAVAALIAWWASPIGPAPFLLVLLLEGAFALWHAGRTRRVLAGVDRRARELVQLSELLARLEREPFEAAIMRRLRDGLDVGGESASATIARLARLLQRLDARRNQLFAPVAAILLWTTRHAAAIDAWRARSGPAIAGWLAVVGEFEALCSLASYARENPADPFPEVAPGASCFEGEGLGHPLIPDAACVRNDLALGGDGVRVLVVSGSNMSGKSTLLRTVGVNAVLALAGAPVRAHRLRLSPLAIGATIRIQDSLQAGRSRFFAEITRLRRLADLARGPLPLLFLLDEVLSGTNSHDRRVGAEAVVRGLIGRGAIGLVTTHDLALAEIADRLAPRAANAHFEDRFEDGALHFDYRMKPGVVRNSNALALMRAVGLEV